MTLYSKGSHSLNHATANNPRIADQCVKAPSKRDEINWPVLDGLALEHFSPGNLKRTVSSLMQEWEKSLTPPPQEQPKDLLTGSPPSGRSLAKDLQAAKSKSSSEETVLQII